MRLVPLIYGAAATALAMLVNGPPQTYWGLAAMAGVFFVAYWAKESSRHSVFSRYRPQWTPTYRRAMQLADLNDDVIQGRGWERDHWD